MSVAERAVAASVSVVVPCFNQARFLSAALASVLDQELDGDVECIVVDDGSTDETQGVARDHGVTLLAQENRGLAAARNRGLDAASGSLVVFLDADDCLTPGALSVNASALATRPDAAFVFGHCTLTGPDGTALTRRPSTRSTSSTTVPFWPAATSGIPAPCCTGKVALPRSVVSSPG